MPAPALAAPRDAAVSRSPFSRVGAGWDPSRCAEPAERWSAWLGTRRRRAGDAGRPGRGAGVTGAAGGWVGRGGGVRVGEGGRGGGGGSAVWGRRGARRRGGQGARADAISVPGPDSPGTGRALPRVWQPTCPSRDLTTLRCNLSLSLSLSAAMRQYPLP